MADMEARHSSYPRVLRRQQGLRLSGVIHWCERHFGPEVCRSRTLALSYEKLDRTLPLTPRPTSFKKDRRSCERGNLSLAVIYNNFVKISQTTYFMPSKLYRVLSNAGKFLVIFPYCNLSTRLQECGLLQSSPSSLPLNMLLFICL